MKDAGYLLFYAVVARFYLKGKKMKNFLLIFCLSAIIQQTTATAQLIKLPLRITDDSKAVIDLEAGSAQNATVGIDVELGERSLPNILWPPQLHAIFVLEGGEHSYKSYLPSESGKKYYHQYRFDISPLNYRTGTVKILWDFPLSANIDSARIIDRKGNGITVNKKLDQGGTLEVLNEFTEQFLLQVWYNEAVSSIFSSEDATAKILINGFSHEFAIKSNTPPQKIVLYDILGQVETEIEYAYSVNIGTSGVKILAVLNQNGEIVGLKTIYLQ